MNTVAQVLETAEIVERDGEWHLLFGALDRTLYIKCQQVMKNLRGEWRRKDNAHVFPYNPTPEIKRYCEEGYLPPVNPYAFFPTPVEQVRLAVEMADIPETDDPLYFLEPSAGDGRMALEIIRRYPTAVVDCIELDEKNREILAARGLTVVAENFETFQPTREYDFVIMNPPFQGNTYKKHIRKAFGMLAKNGAVVSVVPAMYRHDIDFRNWFFEFHGDSEDIGSPFEDTQTKCEIIKIVNFNTAHLWTPNDGYDSSYHRAVGILLDADVTFYRSLPATIRSIDSAVERFIKEGIDLLWDDRVRDSVLRSYGLLKATPVDAPVNPKQLASL